MKGLSLFSSAGMGETYLHECNIDIIAANELLPRRAELHRKLFPNCNMICGDITDISIYDSVIKAAQGIEFLIASPPCQGMSVAGKNRHTNTMLEDPRNYLVTVIFLLIAAEPMLEKLDRIKVKYGLVE